MTLRQRQKPSKFCLKIILLQEVQASYAGFSFHKRFNPYAPGSSWQNRLSAVTRRFMPGEAPVAAWGRAPIKKAADSAAVALAWARRQRGDSSHQKGCRLGHGRAAWARHQRGDSSHQKGRRPPVGNLRPYQAHELSGACLTAGWRRPCRVPRSRRGGTAGWRRGREGSQGR